MTNYDIIEALGQITREKNIDREFLLETLETGLLSAAKKKFGTDQNVEIRIDDVSGEIEIYCRKKVVKEVTNSFLEITLRKARKTHPDANIGDDIDLNVTFEEFGRNAIQTVRQIVVQRIREAEREKVFNEYGKRIGEIVTGSVQQIDKGNVLINLGKVEAILPVKEQIKKERFYQGDTIRAVVTEVMQAIKGPQVVISRTHDDFLRRLFELEVPEIFEGLVQIKSVAREPGQRAKIAVLSLDPRIDPIGSCVGYKGSRVQAIVRELAGERIDIVPWNSDPKKFVANALSPARISNIILFAEQRKMTVIVEDDQLSLAIGKNGQNARLAAKLTNWKLDLLNKSQYEELLNEARAAETNLEEITTLEPAIIQKLIDNGYETVQDLENVLPEELMEIEGIDEPTAKRIIEAVDEKLDQIDDSHEDEEDEDTEDNDNADEDITDEEDESDELSDEDSQENSIEETRDDSDNDDDETNE